MTIQRVAGMLGHLRFWTIALSLGLSVGVASCTPQAPTPSTNAPPDATTETTSPEPSTEQIAIQVEEFTIDAVIGQGCSMALMRSDRIPEDRTYIFFNPMQPENMMQMKINGEMQTFERTQGVGLEFYGQFESQTFVNKNTETSVQVDVRQTDSTQMDEGFGVEGTLRVSQGNQENTLNVKGSAGC